jgi:putative ABC transport system substrate-binding protein
LKALQEGLRDVGYTEGRNIRFEIRAGEGRSDLLSEKAAELVRRKVDILVAWQTPPAMAAKQATSEIPTVLAGVGDPVGTGLVASLVRPGGNVTGTSTGTAEVAGKSVELIREVLPAARRFAVLANETDTFAPPYLAEIGRVARSVGMEMESVMVRPAEPLEAAFGSMIANRVEAVIIQGSLLRQQAVDLVIKHRLPSVSSVKLLPH